MLLRDYYGETILEKVQRLEESKAFAQDEREILRVVRRLAWLRKNCAVEYLHLAYSRVFSENAKMSIALKALINDPDCHLPEENVVTPEEQARLDEESKRKKKTKKTAEDAKSKEGGTDNAMADESASAPAPAATEHVSVRLANFLSPNVGILSKKWLIILAVCCLVDVFVKKSRRAENPSTDPLATIAAPLCIHATQLIHEHRDHSSDFLDAKIYLVTARVCNLSGMIPELCSILTAAYRSAVLANKQMCIATIINQLIQAYLADGNTNAAVQFTQLSKFPEQIRSTPQTVRFLFNLGRIQAVRLEYSDALEKIVAAIRKLPSNDNYAFGFKLMAYKHAIVVELLMGDIPAIQTFQQKSFKYHLKAYEDLVLAVRNGEMGGFEKVLTENSTNFQKDGTLFLIERLHHSVIKVGLRKISLAYSRITLDDISRILKIPPQDHTENIVSKAIVDGVVSGYIDPEQKCLISKINLRTFKGAEAAESFSKRILFCSQMYKDAQKALQYPEEESLKARAIEDELRRKQQAEERTRAEADEEDDGYDDDF